MKCNLSLLSSSITLANPPVIMVRWNAGLGAVVDGSSQERSIPVWASAADDRRHIIGGLQVGQVMQGRATTIQTCSSVKLSTGNWLWNAGKRLRRQIGTGPPKKKASLYSLLYGTPPRYVFESTTSAPNGTRLSVTGLATAQFRYEVYQSRDGHHIRLQRPQAVHVRAAPAVVQEVPLPLCIHPSGATWLKLKVVAPQVGGVFDNHRGTSSTQQLSKGRVSAEVATDTYVKRDYSRLAFGLRSTYSASRDRRGVVHTSFEPPEFYAKLQHNKERLSASWHGRNGLRLKVSHIF